MKVLEWSMTIPKNKQDAFVKWFKNTAGPQLNKFGAINHEIYKIEEKQIVGRQTVQTNGFIERLYFEDNFDIPNYFAKVKEDLDAWRISRMYEEKFEACNIELRILNKI